MHLKDVYALFTTPDIRAQRDFYVRYFAAEIVFEASWVVFLSLPVKDGERSLAFMTPDHPGTAPGPERFEGSGVLLTLEVADAAAAHSKAEAAGAPITYPLTDEPWGQRRFMMRDPAGVKIDIVEQTRPDAGFWERYSVPA